MSNRFARKAGNWNASDVWSDTPTGTAGAQFIPVAGDVAMANGYTITINVDATCLQVRNDTTGGATAGGSFTLSNGVTLNANVFAGGAGNHGVTFSSTIGYIIGNVSFVGVINDIAAARNIGSGTLNITGNLTAGANNAAHAAWNTSTGIINIIGNVTGGSGGSNANGVRNDSSGTINITGNVTGGSGTSANGANNTSTGTINITGNVTSGSGSNAYGVNNSIGTININGSVLGGIAHGLYNASSGTINVTVDVIAGSACGVVNSSTGIVNITGNAIGGTGPNGWGVYNASTGIVNITGNAIGGTASGAYGAYNVSVGFMTVGCAVGNDHGLGYSTNNGTPGVYGYGINTGTQQATTKVKAIKYGAKGQSPTAGLVLLDTSDLANSYANVRDASTYNVRILVPAESMAGALPNQSDVRYGTLYNFAYSMGTCMIPPANSVAYGVPFDNTIGTALLDADLIRKIVQASLVAGL
jgi:hypothetical protein